MSGNEANNNIFRDTLAPNVTSLLHKNQQINGKLNYKKVIGIHRLNKNFPWLKKYCDLQFIQKRSFLISKFQILLNKT